MVDEAAVSMALQLLSCEPGRRSDWFQYRTTQDLPSAETDPRSISGSGPVRSFTKVLTTGMIV